MKNWENKKRKRELNLVQKVILKGTNTSSKNKKRLVHYDKGKAYHKKI